ncbi:restriction endonuclease subunit S [Cronobacter dublinensis]
MAKYKAYPEYKDSGVEWCTALPVGWKRTNLRWLSSIYAGGTPSKNVIDYWENGTVPWINSGAVNQSYITEPSTFISKAAFENSSARWIPKGALVVALAGQGKTKGMVAQLGINTTCNQSMAAIVFPKKSLSRYMYWWLRSNYQNVRNMAGGDLRDGLNLELLGDIQCPQPNDDECIRISAFLDHETAKIDSLIEKQKQLIELLKEKRQAVISHAVTKGLNPDVPMKDSGVEWLGEIPEHWSAKPLKFLCTCNDQVISESAEQDCEIEYVDIGSVNSSQGITKTETMLFSKAPSRARRLVKDGDVIISTVRTYLEAIATIINPPVNMIVSTGFAVIRPSVGLNHAFAAYFLRASGFMKEVVARSVGVSYPAINASDLINIPVPNMPLTEQLQIANFLDLETAKIDSLIEKQQQQITLLQERRIALISAAVTGKIDVRDWRAPDAQKTEEPQEATI